MKIILSRDITDELYRHAGEIYPEECCGFIFGRDGKERRATFLSRVHNVREGDRHKHFQIDPSDYRKAEQFADEHDLDLLGVYHSHPDHPAEPSKYDHRSALPWFSYIIVSVREGSVTDIQSWRLNDDRSFSAETVKIVT